MEKNRENKERPDFGLIQGEKEKKKDKIYYGKLLIGIVFIIMFIEYYAYVFEVMIKNMNQKNFGYILTLLIIFHILLLLVLIAFISTMKTNPGEIPLYWGFIIGDEDYKRKRYCLICNAFKPERAHHCSVCNRCVLNMDHHCPWVDNCIGFYNRKFFMQLLFFVTILTIYIDISEIYFVIDMTIKLFKLQIKYSELVHIGFVIICYLAVFIFSFVIALFFKFHLGLVLNNSTTIESLDKEHEKENEKYNINPKDNWEQVFGNEILFWFIPFSTKSGKPEGDGLSWKNRDLLSRNDNQNEINSNRKIGTNNYETNFNSNNIPISAGTK